MKDECSTYNIFHFLETLMFPWKRVMIKWQSALMDNSMFCPQEKINISFPEYNIGGVVHKLFQSVATAFKKNFENGLETAGASFAVYYENNLIINLYGGYRDIAKKKPWTEETRTVLFSTTKSISSVVLAYVLDRENIKYDTKISSFWPEFAKNGKQNITILDASLHRAGLAYSDSIVEREDVLNPKKISEFFENSKQMTNGNEIVYHALTFGFLIDQIVRRLDRSKRGVYQILNEDFINKYNIKHLSLGLKNKEENENVATLTSLDEKEVSRQGKLNPIALERYNAGDNIHNQKLYTIFPWITINDYNEIDNRLLPMPSNMGIGNACGLAQFHSLILNGSTFSEEMIHLLEKPVLNDIYDCAIGYNESKGYGFQFTKNSKGNWIFGHSGLGGQNIRVDVHNKLSFAYVSNGLKISDADMVETWKNLVDELYKIVDQF